MSGSGGARPRPSLLSGVNEPFLLAVLLSLAGDVALGGNAPVQATLLAA